jgi:hypothetical protein
MSGLIPTAYVKLAQVKIIFGFKIEEIEDSSNEFLGVVNWFLLMNIDCKLISIMCDWYHCLKVISQ